MFERKDEEGIQTATDATTSTVNTTDTPTTDLPDYGMFAGAKVTAADGTATVTVPLRRGKLILETDEPLICAWAIDNAAGAVTTEAKKYKP